MTEWIPVIITALICGTVFAIIVAIAALVNAPALARALKMVRGLEYCIFCKGWGARGWERDHECGRCCGTGDEPKP